MELFQIANNQLIPSTHALLIPPFSEIWSRDIDNDKTNAKNIFKYVELTCNPRKSNPFAGYSEDERPKKVKKLIFGEENPHLPLYMIDDIIRATMAYKEMLEISSPSYGLWIDALNAIHKLRLFLRGFDMDERTPHGAMVLKPRDVVVALAGLADVEKSMQIQRDKVQGELTDNTRTRNARVIGEFER